MRINFNCESCGQLLGADESGAGLVVRCPSCDSCVTVPQPASDNILVCPHCGGTNRQDLKVCLYCRRDLVSGDLHIPKRQQSNARSKARRNQAHTDDLLSLVSSIPSEQQPVHASRREEKPSKGKERNGFALVCVIATGFVLGFCSVGILHGMNEEDWEPGQSIVIDIRDFLSSVFRDR